MGEPVSINTVTTNSDFKTKLKDIRITNLNRIVISHININSIRNKFELLAEAVMGNVDILMVTETKIDETFPTTQFIIPGFTSPYRFDRTKDGGGILVYIREDIPSKLLNILYIASDIECLGIEVNLRKAKWLVICSYNSHKNNISNHLENLSKVLNRNLSQYERFLCIGDFNSEITEFAMKIFCDIYHLKNLVNVPTCYKNPLKSSCIDLFLTNCSRSFQDTQVIETGLSDFHKMNITVLKMFFSKQKHETAFFRNYKKFDNSAFREALNRELLKYDLNNIEYDTFQEIIVSLLNVYAPLKKKYLRANHASFVTKELRKAIMLRTRFRNIYLKQRTETTKVAYNRQRNKCVSILKKSKKSYFESLDTKFVKDYKKFWKRISPPFSNKIKSKEKITLVENDEIISSDIEVAKTFQNFFSSIVKNLNIQRDETHLSKTTQENPVLACIEKFSKHPSIVSIEKRMETTSNKFSFKYEDRKKFLTEIENLNSRKASQQNDIPVKILKVNSDICSYILHHNFNNSLFSNEFPKYLKKADITPVFKKDEKFLKTNYRPVSILPTVSKIYERCLYDQINEYFQSLFSKLQCGFRNRHSAQHCLLVLIEKCRKVLDKRGFGGLMLTDLSKAFD